MPLKMYICSYDKNIVLFDINFVYIVFSVVYLIQNTEVFFVTAIIEQPKKKIFFCALAPLKMLDPLPLKMLVEFIKFFLNNETFCALHALGYQPPPSFLPSPPLNLQTAQAPLFRQSPLYIGFS